ncbi:MAG: hypothetical protein KDD40_08340 [Bdellovibrionales bacterium]|nr:hypothetical protein [Bdellovibrionales bacterium]
MIFLPLLFSIKLHALNPLPTESIQLEQLIHKSEEQIKNLQQILKYSQQDALALDKATKILTEMSEGINKSIEPYKGTEVYNQALLELQQKNEFENVYWDSQRIRESIPLKNKNIRSNEKHFVDLVQFQKESVKANREDLSHQSQLEKALGTAQLGFIPRLQTQAQLGNWQANTRLSTQMTELLAVMHAIREELRAMRSRENQNDYMGLLIQGSEQQNKKLREERQR